MTGGPTVDEWIERYERGHQHPVNRFCHLLGIPMIGLSVVLVPVALVVDALWPAVIVLFLLGWALQFIGHWFEHKLPEFFKDWRFLFVGLRWWSRKIRGRA